MKRLLVVGAVLILLMGLAGVFWTEVYGGFLEPVARAGWLLLRLTVLSVDQGVLWALGVFVAVMVLVVRVAQNLGTEQSVTPRSSSMLPAEVARWESLLVSGASDGRFDTALQRDLVWTLVSLYTLKHRIPVGFEVADRFRQGTLPLPPEVRRLLFEQRPVRPPFPWSLLTIPRSRASREAWGREHLNLVVRYLETLLEDQNE